MRYAVVNDSIVRLVRKANDHLDQSISELLETIANNSFHPRVSSHSYDVACHYHENIESPFTHSDSGSPAERVDIFELQYTSEQSSPMSNPGEKCKFTGLLTICTTPAVLTMLEMDNTKLITMMEIQKQFTWINKPGNLRLVVS